MVNELLEVATCLNKVSEWMKLKHLWFLHQDKINPDIRHM